MDDGEIERIPRGSRTAHRKPQADRGKQIPWECRSSITSFFRGGVWGGVSNSRFLSAPTVDRIPRKARDLKRKTAEKLEPHQSHSHHETNAKTAWLPPGRSRNSRPGPRCSSIPAHLQRVRRVRLPARPRGCSTPELTTGLLGSSTAVPQRRRYDPSMATTSSWSHWTIASYDDGPPPTAPRMIALCVSGRHVGESLVTEVSEVTCPSCLAYLRELGIR